MTISPATEVEGRTLEFDEAVYRAWNPDVDAAICAGTLPSGRVHFEAFGRAKRRPPFLAAEEPRAAAPFRRRFSFARAAAASHD